MLKDFLYWWRAMFRRSEMEKEMDEELSAHVERLARKFAQNGLTGEEAMRKAKMEFGGLDQVKEGCRDARGVTFIETTIQDFRYGLRMLARNPGFAAVAVLTLALGIGANTAIFSVVNAVILRPLPYPQSGRLVWIAEFIPSLKAELASGADYLDWRDQNQVLESVTAFDPGGSFNMTGRGTPARVHAAQVGANFFSTLGVSPSLGRSFTAEEDRPNGRNSAILTHAFWQQYFGSSPNVLGQSVTLNGAPYTVVGVMPASFRFPGQSDIQMITPLALNEANERLRMQNRLVRIIGRLKEGVTLARAQSDLDAIRVRAQHAMEAAGPRSNFSPAPTGGPGPAPGGGSVMRFSASVNPQGVSRERSSSMQGPSGGSATPGGATASPRQDRLTATGPGPIARPHGSNGPVTSPRPGPGLQMRLSAPPDIQMKVVALEEHLAGNLRPAALILLGVVGLVLLIACANVANLMLTRASARTREVAVRAALGAGRWRLIRQLLSESLLLALLGGFVGLAIAASLAGVMTRMIPPNVGGDILGVVQIQLDARVLLFTLAISVFTGVLFGLAPALAAARLDLAEGLKEGSQLATTGRRGWIRGMLAVTELSLALVLSIGAGLLIKSFYRVLAVHPGFAPERVLTLNLSLTDSRYPSAQKRTEFFSELLRRVEALPGVRSAAIVDSLPLTPYRARMMIRQNIVNPQGAQSNTTVMMSRMTISPAYFYTLGIPLLQGRTFTDHDDEQAAKVAVVNEALASRMWPGQNPIGRQLPLPGDTINVVGVVGNTHHEGLSSEVESEIFVPYLQQPGDSMQLAVRTAIEPSSLVAAVRAQIAAIDPEQPVYNLTTLEQSLAESVAPRRFTMLLLGIFAGIALTLATVGIYGVMAFSVTQRRHEIGIRMALGADRRDVLRLIVLDGLRLTLAGVVMGVIGAWGLTRFLNSFLFGVRATDALTFVLVSVILVVVSVLAAYLPARRATEVDPMVALRYE